MSKPAIRGLRTTKAEISSLISTLVIRLLERTISKLPTSKFSSFELVPVADETGLSLALSEASKIGFVPSRPKILKTADCFIESVHMNTWKML